MRADGYLFLFNRETGEPLLPIEEREVPQDPHQLTVPTQPFPTQTETILFECSYWRDRVAPPFQLNCSSYTPPSVDEQTVVAPGVPIPLVRVTPLAFSPQTGYIYAQGRAHVGRARRFADPFVWNTARFHLTLPDAVGVLAAVDTATGRVVWKNEMPSAFLGVSGPLVTAGGLLFRGSPGGQAEAYDVRTGVRRWAFRTSQEGSRLRPGPASAYELDGTQYIAIAMGPALWAFTLDGAVPARGEPSPDPPVDDQPSGPAPRETDEIDTATLLENPRGSVGGRRYAFDEHNFNPVPRAGHRGHAGPVHQQRRDRPHRGRARRQLEHRHPRAWPVGLRHVRRAGDVPLSLRGPSVGGGGDHGRSVTASARVVASARERFRAWWTPARGGRRVVEITVDP